MTGVSRQTLQLEDTSMTTVTRLSRHEAAARLQVSEATIDRMIRRGELATEKESQGSRYKVWVIMSEDSFVSTGAQTGLNTADKSVETGLPMVDETVDTAEPSVYTNGDEVVALRTERDGLRGLVTYLQEHTKDAEWRYQELLQQLRLSQENVATLVRALPAVDTRTPTQRRRWWPFGKG